MCEDLQIKLKKSQELSKQTNKVKNALKDAEQELFRMRKELIEQKDLNSKNQDKLAQSRIQSAKPAPAPSTYNNGEIKRLQTNLDE